MNNNNNFATKQNDELVVSEVFAKQNYHQQEHAQTEEQAAANTKQTVFKVLKRFKDISISGLFFTILTTISIIIFFSLYYSNPYVRVTDGAYVILDQNGNQFWSNIYWSFVLIAVISLIIETILLYVLKHQMEKRTVQIPCLKLLNFSNKLIKIGAKIFGVTAAISWFSNMMSSLFGSRQNNGAAALFGIFLFLIGLLIFLLLLVVAIVLVIIFSYIFFIRTIHYVNKFFKNPRLQAQMFDAN